MVVASSGWMQNANFSPNESDNNINSGPDNNKMSAKGILICRDNSHAFQNRTLNLEHPVKIGRSVARTRAAADNAIFDCKVLSRNHALLWYNAGKFYLQDTRSSNGTFVNNQRLSAIGSESAAKEVCSGDIVQFGVDVVESTKKVTHGCIIATLKLYLPDGKEAKASKSMYMPSAAGDVTIEDLYKLNQYVQEASRREKVLHSKLAYLEKLVENTKKAASQSWKALIDEDRLLSRVKLAESQLVVYSKNFNEDKIRKELIKREEEKSQYQIAAKEALEKVHQEKLQITEKLINLESRLNETEEECQSLHEISKHSQMELQELASKYMIAQQNLAQLETKLNENQSDNMLSNSQSKVNKIDQFNEIRMLQRKLRKNHLDSVKIHKKITGLKNYMQTLQDINSKLLSEDSKDGINPIEVINSILDTLHEMIVETEDLEAYDNISDVEDTNTKSDVDSNQKVDSDTQQCYYKNELDKSDAEAADNEDNYSEYILPPLNSNSRRTLVNGNKSANDLNCDVHLASDNNSELTDDTCSAISDDVQSITSVTEDVTEKSVIEMKPVGDYDDNLSAAVDQEPDKFRVKFVHYEWSDVLHDEQNSDSSNSNGSATSSSFSSAVNDNFMFDNNNYCQDDSFEVNKIQEIGYDNRDDASNNHVVLKDDDDDDEKEEEEDKKDGEFIKTLKPAGKNSCECTSPHTHNKEYILQLLMTVFESLDADDDIQVQKLVKQELNDLRNWLVQETSESVLDKLKEIYYRTKNEKSRMQEINEELVLVKEQYNSCYEDKLELSKQYETLKVKCTDSLDGNYSGVIKYVVPAIGLLLWLLFEKLF